MYKHILIPTDGSELAAKGVSAGIDYAREAGAKVLFFTAVPEYQIPSEAELMSRHVKSIAQYERESEAAARAVLDKVAADAKSANITFNTEFARSDRPYEAIIDAAKRHQCDAIFMASHVRTGLAALWHGSQTQDVLTHSDIPTLVYR
jgi:nucleotide-binding universal stress UspA family protein